MNEKHAAPKRPPFRAAIFDLDGVLVDTAEFHYLAWKQIAEEIGVAFDRRKNERLRGVPRMASLEIIVEEMPRKPAHMESLAAQKNEVYVAMIERLTPADLLPGVRRLLKTLKAEGIRIGLGSSSKNARAVIRLLEVESLLEVVVDGYGFERAKPYPDVFLNAGRLLGVSPANCVVVEDAPSGIAAAKAAGMFAVGISPDGALRGADLMVKAPAEIPLALWGITSST